MLFSDLALARRLERAEGHACVQFSEARRRVFPEMNLAWMETGGTYAVFDGPESPLTQTFGLGLFEGLTPAILDSIEGFFHAHDSPVLHEVSPFAGVAALDLLCSRNYRPFELSSVLYRPVEAPAVLLPENVSVWPISPDDAPIWTEISARGWSHDHPELRDFLLGFGAISSSREHSVCFLAAIDGVPGAAGALCLHEGVALFGGSATVPELRRRGLQAALLDARMVYASSVGCDLAMMVAETGSNSQRNAERRGFQIAYTRTKWRLG